MKSCGVADPSWARAERESDSDKAAGVSLCLVITVREQSAAPAGPSARDNHTTYSPFIIISFSFLALKGLPLQGPLLSETADRPARLLSVLAGAFLQFCFAVTGRGGGRSLRMARSSECLGVFVHSREWRPG